MKHPFRGVGAAARERVPEAERRGRLAPMATFEDVERIALALPETTRALSREQRHWRGGDKSFVWERPLRRSDLEHLGDAAPDGPILGARVEHEGAKRALIETNPD